MQSLPTVTQFCSVHRSMNERSQRLAPALSVSMKCACECQRAECASTFRISMGADNAVRSDGRLFAVVSGHESREETVVARLHAYLVIKKSGEPARSALRLDPRAA
jgi:hypothetical protein